MSKVTPPNAAGVESETVNTYDDVPEFPSVCVTFPIDTTGKGLHNRMAVAELRGAGATTVKSALLTSVSVQPEPALTSAVVFSVIPAAAIPSKQLAAPKPTKSTMLDPGDGQAVVKRVALLTRAIFPAITEMFDGEPTTSGVGSAAAVPGVSPAKS
jgi:hypothetical protein